MLRSTKNRILREIQEHPHWELYDYKVAKYLHIVIRDRQTGETYLLTKKHEWDYYRSLTAGRDTPS